MRTKISRDVIKSCPFKSELDYGKLEIIIPGMAPELYQLGEKIDQISAMPISHENFVISIQTLLPEGSEVRTWWRTGPWEVEVISDGDERLGS